MVWPSLTRSCFGLTQRPRQLEERMFQDLFSLKGRVALVTGGSRGIGKMIAAGFLSQGAGKVYLTARKAGPCEATAKELSAQYGGECIALPIDISTMSGIDMLAAEIKKREPKLDILVNNAGAAWGADFDEFPESGWDKVVNLNLKTPFFLTKALADSLRAAATADKPAKVINVASIDGIFVNPMETYSYAASKSGLIHLTRRMAVKLIRDHIVVTAIAHQFELGRLLDRKIGRLCTFENLIDIGSGAPMQINEARSIGHQAADSDIVPEGMRRRQAAVCR